MEEVTNAVTLSLALVPDVENDTVTAQVRNDSVNDTLCAAGFPFTLSYVAPLLLLPLLPPHCAGFFLSSTMPNRAERLCG
jgi:hypothetical protein